MTEFLVNAATKYPAKHYFVSMEGDLFESWHFNLFNPLTSTLITLSYSWGHDDPMAIVKTSANFHSPDLSEEREFLQRVARDPAYGVPFQD